MISPQEPEKSLPKISSFVGFPLCQAAKILPLEVEITFGRPISYPACWERETGVLQAVE